MRIIPTILLLIFPAIGFSQTEIVTEFEMIGIWILTDFDQPEKFRDFWEFTSDGIFNELKYKSDSDTTLVSDESGTWNIINGKLKITVTREDTGGQQKKYSQAQIIEFEISKEVEDIIIYPILGNSINMDKKDKLRLKKCDISD